MAEDIFHTPDPRTDLVKGFGIQAYACHPLLSQGGRVIGTLSFGSKTKTHFADDELALMKAVTDQVATAMGRIRLLNDERHRAQELQAVLDAVPAIVWIAHDPESRKITGSRASYELLRLPSGANASKTAPEGEEPTNFRVMRNGKELPLDQLPVQMAARGTEIRDCEIDVVFEDGMSRHLLGDAVPLLDGDGRPRGSVAAFMDITELKQAEERERELEAHKREFYQRTILAATEGRLLICEQTDIEKLYGTLLGSWRFTGLEDIGRTRDSIIQLTKDAGMDRVHQFVGCAIESIANAYKHAGAGEACLYRTEDGLLLVTSDSGPGISKLRLPDVALTKGYSTAGTLGMGYKIMLHFADKVYLATNHTGTTVAIQMKLQPSRDAVPADAVHVANK